MFVINQLYLGILVYDAVSSLHDQQTSRFKIPGYSFKSMNKVRLALMMLILLGSIFASKNLMAIADASLE
ncbi:hypothetical protein [Nostoc sp. XA010]|uniref:hypothetical protein n=1 Tax=Nostoc sp. XA010 TaxID=2780407 RepID=UPI001E5468BD|nr:hypothetical protein [Nostoc sp. XA010]